MSQLSQVKPGGNTKPPGKYQAVNWCFTIPASEGITASQLSQVLKQFANKFTFQKERGENTGYEHWQGYCHLTHKEYMGTFKNMLGFQSAHIEPCMNVFASIKYCSKPESRIEGPFNEESIFIHYFEPRLDWSIKATNEFLIPCSPSERRIVWIWENKGNKDKSSWADYMEIVHKAILFEEAKKEDIACRFATLDQEVKIVIFDFTRDCQGHVNYRALESIRNGRIFSPKYKSNMIRFNKPHVICLANFLPDTDKLSSDRWDIREI